jgi:hypothetical protein
MQRTDLTCSDVYKMLKIRFKRRLQKSVFKKHQVPDVFCSQNFILIKYRIKHDAENPLNVSILQYFKISVMEEITETRKLDTFVGMLFSDCVN